MFWIVLLQLIGSLAGLSEAEHETLCTSNACFTLHMNEVLFDKAVQNCDHNGGYVMTVRDREEEDVLRLLLSRIQRKSQDRASTFWIGLKLHKKDCVLPDKTLKGFKWVSGEEDSNYSNWEADEVKCLCKEGYDLDDDGFTCRLKDVCGVGTCEHQCVTTESGYFCKCPDGFRLDANQRNCSDVDECQSQTCEDHVCVNTHGSYTCTCQSGYTMVVGTCVDMDECVQGRCEHSCLNSIGSFLCYCNEGFSLSQDDHSCEDIDECVISLCQFECFNDIGSFRCTCPKGFYLEIDGSTCAQEVTATSASSTEEPNDEETQEHFTESLTRTTVELQHQSPHTNAPILDLVNLPPDDQQNNASSVTGLAESVNSRVIVCVLGSVIPLLLLVAVTMAIAIIRCNRSKKEAKKNTTTDGYCWVSSGLDPRLEKLYESISTDGL
ncbi:hypothetical protein CesoFtcFv8_016867 [Champsocephalus esox]|nr:hypothetical protein CesoFtcFv8_016867 [Champsocephalus esox]